MLIIRRINSEYARRLHSKGEYVGYSELKYLEHYKLNSNIVKNNVTITDKNTNKSIFETDNQFYRIVDI